MARVFEVEHQKLHVRYALKVLNHEFVRNENIRKRFLSEARNMARMSHPNIVKVTDLIDEGDMVAFVMEYIDGQTLKDYLDLKGKLSDYEIKDMFSQMLDAVGYVHEQNLVHRDIKPSNFMLDRRGKIKLMDFGIAKNTDASSAEYTQTGTGMMMGTPMYMSPEQITETNRVTEQSDIYSLGVVLWQMVMGRKPYDTKTLSNFQLQSKIVSERLEKIGNNWDALIQTCTAKEPTLRYKSIETLKAELMSSSGFSQTASNASKKEDGEATMIDKNSVASNTSKENGGNQSYVLSAAVGKGIQERSAHSPGRKLRGGIIAAVLIMVAASIYYFVEYEPRHRDSDHDGYYDVVELCPLEYGNVEGCPDEDNDGISDKDDQCPDQSGLSQFYGCPDDDNDGIADNKDQCPGLKGNDPNGCFYPRQLIFNNNSTTNGDLSLAYFHDGIWICVGWFNIESGETYTYSLPNQFISEEIFWYFWGVDEREWTGGDKYFYVNNDGNSGFRSENGIFIEKDGGWNERVGFHKLSLTGEATEQIITD